MDDIDLTYLKLRKWSFKQLKDELVSTNYYTYIQYSDGKIEWPNNVDIIFEKSSWTKEEFLDYVNTLNKLKGLNDN